MGAFVANFQGLMIIVLHYIFLKKKEKKRKDMTKCPFALREGKYNAKQPLYLVGHNI